MSAAPFDACMVDRHPWVQVIVGKAGSGKTVYMNLVLSMWRSAYGGKSFAADAVCGPRPTAKHLAAWASCWAPEAPMPTPDPARPGTEFLVHPEISLIACDELNAVLGTAHLKPGIFKEGIFRGRHRNRFGVSVLAGTQRAMHVNPDVWSQAQRVVIFRTLDHHDHDRIRQLPGMTETAVKMLPYLEPGYAVIWDQLQGLYYPYVPHWHGAPG